MQQNVIHKLIQQANKLPVLEYDSNPIIFKDNVDTTIREVKQRLGVLQTLKAEIDYQLTLTHTDDEEFT
mgnify:FL=1